jgi:hypothetical protein
MWWETETFLSEICFTDNAGLFPELSENPPAGIIGPVYFNLTKVLDSFFYKIPTPTHRCRYEGFF